MEKTCSRCILGDTFPNINFDKDTGEATPRGEDVLFKTPMNRYGEPDELVGGVIYLASEAASFVTGIVLPIDGGFLAFAGV